MNFGYSPFDYGFLGPIFMILFWGMIIFAIVTFVRMASGHSGKWCNHSQEKNNSALNILKERYAKGEIDKKEFEEKKKDLI
ncbi:MAG: hypothetical protein US93_C0002G0069 [Candidatus Falkowbacteria bacterium GW2011_GWD2_38_42]|uniref:SHOCT domain-containing protein n=1 Tax=Candidatus Falkowbacteria bacterium GW2011_GWE1_38_31 TaxID=1618638 RepID=A0A0G0JX57_9BACT|nr:MAG: hypothetical protein US73_C0001G0069 [Candidatus Falkowbacteria bacterium GW2011_GWF2_38_1205]KKQ64037.1 MAG: hypothetical protein US84_C0002G0069 [Candidatus Falkowbacteria bacterium GW2011_GWF1_38_22]KKQ66615.1 MAG: hypothetical protein US87_C0001G0136 [Candidatus Falkowbacteria bacterium GW2011_GWE2_38_254]KKQ71142.1 MAG: hypothetical protein US91_C0001G0069 [Candidatus Falkowbacteria bacterium GW2011_GWE1_38_31]KKQ73268.1 MAG: hypothetical protein US93_C0002G0069 [Candidatus Falkowb